MKALVIGGSQFFGKKLSARLLDAGYEVTLLNRGNRDDGLGNRVERLKADRGELIQLFAVTRGRTWDVVFDQVCFRLTDAFFAVKVFTGKTARYVFTSSDAVYGTGESAEEKVFDARAAGFDLNKARSGYAGGKQDAEAVFAARAPFPVVSVRLSLVLGLEDPTKRLHFHVERIRDGEEIYFPRLEARTSMIDADTAAKVLHFVGESTFVGAVNAASRSSISMREFADMIERATGKKLISAERETRENKSVYNLAESLSTNVDRLTGLGFTCPDLPEWLPSMIATVADKR